MDILDRANYPLVCRKSDFYGTSDFQNSQKFDPLQILAKKLRPKHTSLSKIFWLQEVD
jgi:hypothetical protein